MANRRDFFFRQKVTEAELDQAFADLENADRALASDLGFVGVCVGMAVSQQVVPNLTVQVSGPGVVYDQTGQRIAIPSTQTVNCAVDEGAISTTVVTPGNSRILSIFAEFDRALTDPRIDGNSNTVFFSRAETFQFNVAAGAEAPSPTAPALRADQILLADITRAFGGTTIVNGAISTTRRQWAFKTSSGIAVAVGTAEEAIQTLATAIAASDAGLAAHLADATAAHAASAISFTPAGSVSAITVQAAIAEVDGDVTAHVTDSSAAHAASAISFSPTGSVAATDVQAAIAEVASEKAALASANTFTQQNDFDSGVDVAGTLELDGGTNEVLYSAGRSRTFQISLAGGASGGWTPGAGQWTSTVVDTQVLFPLNAYLREGMIITAARALVNPAAARGSDMMRLILAYSTPDYAGPGSTTITTIATQNDNTTTNPQVISLSGLNHTVAKTARDYYLAVESGDPTTGDLLFGLEITVTDPGPRNY